MVVIGFALWAAGGRYVSTDNAYVQTGRVQVSSSYSGHVVEVAIHENQRVRKGQLLFRVESDEPDNSVEQAQAQLRTARAAALNDRALYRQRLAEVAAAQSDVDFRRRELARDRGLAADGAVSREDAEASAHALNAAVQQLAVSRQQLAAAVAALGGDANAPTDSAPAVALARAQLQRAQIVKGDTVIVAPQDGIVTRVSQLQVGSYVQASAPVFVLITDDLWVEANFKEGDLAHMRPGQSATVKVDAYPDLKLEARIDSLGPGTGSSFSLLPPENATGNWVKVVQRVPVHLVFTRRPPIPLQGGLSADVRVDTLHSRFGGGHSR